MQCEGELVEAFKKSDFQAAAAGTIKLTYLTKLVEEIGEKERRHERNAA